MCKKREIYFSLLMTLKNVLMLYKKKFLKFLLKSLLMIEKQLGILKDN